MKKKDELTQKEKMSYVKFARNNIVAADDMASILLDLRQQLESIGLLSKNRLSKQKRDLKLESIASQRLQSDIDVQEMMNFIPSHPDSERIINSLFKNITVPKYVKKTIPEPKPNQEVSSKTHDTSQTNDESTQKGNTITTKT